MQDGYLRLYDPDAYEPIFGRSGSDGDRFVRIGVRRRNQDEIDRRRERRLRRETEARIMKGDTG